MSQILHIFRKDLRHLWPQVTVVLLLVAAHAVFDPHTAPVSVREVARVNTIAETLVMLLPLCIAFLIGLLVFQEALVGDRQFWLTRPYYWPKLLAAKILFFLIFFSVPLFLSDCYILGAQGFPVLAVL